MKPRHPIHPGEILPAEFLSPAGVSQRQFAAKLGCTTAKLNELVKGKRGVTAESALDLAEALGTSPELWMNLQMMWDLRRAEIRRKASESVLRRRTGPVPDRGSAGRSSTRPTSPTRCGLRGEPYRRIPGDGTG